MNLDDELKRAFAREAPPADFAARTIARADTRAASALPRWVMPRWTLAAAAVLILGVAGYGYRWQQGEAAKRDVLLAFRITATKVNQIQMQVTK